MYNQEHVQWTYEYSAQMAQSDCSIVTEYSIKATWLQGDDNV